MISLTTATFRARSSEVGQPTLSEFDDPKLHRRAAAAWALLLFNVMPYARTLSILPIPNSVGKALGQTALPLALLMALSVNRKLKFRPSVFLCLASLLALEACVTALAAQYPKGTAFRTVRLIDFVVSAVASLSLLGTREAGNGAGPFSYERVVRRRLLCNCWTCYFAWEGEKRRQAERYHLVQPVYSGGTLRGGSTWYCDHSLVRPSDSRQVRNCNNHDIVHRSDPHAHENGAARGPNRTPCSPALSMMPTSARVRKTFAIAAVVTLAVYVTAASAIASWLARGQGTQQLSNLTGRTNFWGPLLAYPRDRFEMIFGFGLSNGSFRGLPIDSNWLDSYQDQGLFGIVVCAMILIFLIIAACVQVKGVNRALALFLAVYCLVASFTEDGITNPSPYLLDAAVAASLIAPPIVARTRRRFSGKGVAPPPWDSVDPAEVADTLTPATSDGQS